ncbi:hypothetical protein [Patulibacter minatonensis]|uniref:RipA family octameric membrane protein n=1 Tax=Patulibacter minatonensis TaxID=298163 RepID=UPI0004798F47|nr:hypothetical protein [Patulibacter minatonensis]
MADPDALLYAQYGRAVEEYRFQVDLNWRRSQSYFVLCAAVLAACFAVLSAGERVPDALGVLAFAASLAITIVAAAASHTQTGYYRAARQSVADLEGRLGISEFGLRTTPGMGSPVARRYGRVTTLQNLVFAVLGLVSVVGAFAAAGVVGDRKDADAPEPARTTCTARSSDSGARRSTTGGVVLTCRTTAG